MALRCWFDAKTMELGMRKQARKDYVGLPRFA